MAAKKNGSARKARRSIPAPELAPVSGHQFLEDIKRQALRADQGVAPIDPTDLMANMLFVTRKGDSVAQLLRVTRENLALIVEHVAPDLCLIPRQSFEQVATSMLSIVEGVARDGRPKH